MPQYLAKEAFYENLNTEFRLVFDPSTTVKLELFEIVEGQSTPKQEQFALHFRGPLDMTFEQGMRNVEHEKMGAFVLFFVPIGRESEGMIYESVFNRFVKEDKNNSDG